MIGEREKDIVRAGAGEENRRVYAFIDRLQSEGLWEKFTPEERLEVIQAFLNQRVGRPQFVGADAIGPLGNEREQRRLALIAQETPRPADDWTAKLGQLLRSLDLSNATRSAPPSGM